MDIDTDGAGGNLFVTGVHEGKIWIAKIKSILPTGAGICKNDTSLIAWQKEPANGIGYGIRFGPDGYVYVVGSRSDWDGACWVDKMDALTGTSLSGWPKTYTNCYAGNPICNAGGCGDGARASIDIDTSGNVYVSGFPMSGGSVTNNFRLLKLNSSGTQVWSLDYDSGGIDVTHDMALDSQGRAFVVGETFNNTVVSAVMTNPAGGSWNWGRNITWGSFVSGYAGGRRQGIKTDSDNVYVVGQYRDSAGGGMFLYRWSLSTDQLIYNWVYNTIYLAGGLFFHDLALGPNVCNGSLFVTGNSGSAWLGRFNSQGLFVDSTLDTTADRGDALAVDAQGFVYLAGTGRTGGIWIAKFFANCDVPPPQPPPGPQPPPQPSPLTPIPCRAYNYPNPKHSGQPTTIHWELPRAVDTEVKIIDLLGDTVMKWHFLEGHTGGWAGINEILWDGKNSDGKRVHQGMYHVVVETRGGICKKTFRMGVIP